MPAIRGVSISPDGKGIAYFRPYEGEVYLAIEELGSDARTVLVPPIEDLRFRWVHWANDKRLVFAMEFPARRGFTETNETRLLGIDRDGRNVESIIRNATRIETGSHIGSELPPAQIQDNVVDWLPESPDHMLVSLDADHDNRFEVRRIDIRNGKHKVVDIGQPGAQDYVTDESGRIRFGWGYWKNGLAAWYRQADGEWIDASDSDWWRAGFAPVALDSGAEIAFVQGPDENGRSCIRRARLETGEFLETVFEHDSVDVDGLLLDPVTGDPVGVRYTTDLPRDRYFDEQLTVMQRSIDKALPGASNRIASLSSDRRQVIIHTTSAVDPGAYYHWNRDAKSFDFLGEIMPDLPVESVVAKKAISYEARDGTTIPGYLTLPEHSEPGGIAAVILPHGGPRLRDDIRFDYLSQFLASRGYAVLQPNFRGSVGYGDAFRDAGLQQWGGLMQDDVTDGVRWLVEQGIADESRLCIVGGSYGGYAAAMGAVKTPELYRCAASINGVLDLDRLVEDDRAYIGGEVWVEHMGLEGEKLKSVSPLHQAERIRIPMLIVQAEDDVRVHAAHGRTMAARLSKLGREVKLVKIKRGGHTLTNADGRARMLRELEDFLARHIGE